MDRYCDLLAGRHYLNGHSKSGPADRTVGLWSEGLRTGYWQQWRWCHGSENLWLCEAGSRLGIGRTAGWWSEAEFVGRIAS